MATKENATELAVIAKMEERAKAKIEDLRRGLVIQELLLSELKEARVSLANQKRNNEPSLPSPISVTNHGGEIGGKELFAEVHKVLNEAKKPMRLMDIAQLLTERGFIPRGGQSMLNAVFVVIKRQEDVVEKVKRGVYRLKE